MQIQQNGKVFIGLLRSERCRANTDSRLGSLNTNLDALLEAIKSDLVLQGKFDEYREHYERLASVNRAIEKTIARRYSLEQFEEWLVETGFEIVRSEPKYFDAVEVIHARKL